jgi:hypothetical protein
LKGLRISTDSADFVIKHKEATVCLLTQERWGLMIDDCKTCFFETYF